MRTILTIILCMLIGFGLNYAISYEPLQIINQYQIEARTENGILLISIYQKNAEEIGKQINWILTIIENYYNDTDVVFITPIGDFRINKKELKKYYSIALIDREATINLEVMRYGKSN